MNEWLHEIIEGLDPVEQDRLRGVHELLVKAGPPPEMPPALAPLREEVPAREPARTIAFPKRRRRLVAGLALAAALVLAAFGGGYLTGNRHGSTGVTAPVRAVTMSGDGALASLRVGAPDAAGNWPVHFSVNGLPQQKSGYAYYEIFVLRAGKPSYPCAGFRVQGGTTKVGFVVPYKVKSATRWVVTEVDRDHAWPGRVVMT